MDERVNEMYAHCNSHDERLAIALLWLTGARPSELVLLQRKDISFDDNYFSIQINTLKLANSKRIVPDVRVITFPRPKVFKANVSLEIIIKIISSRNYSPDNLILNYCVRWLQKVTERVTLAVYKQPLSPYHFRHSVFTWGAKKGMMGPELMYLKGSASPRSVEPYVHAQPVVLDSDYFERGEKNIPYLLRKQINSYGQIPDSTAPA